VRPESLFERDFGTSQQLFSALSLAVGFFLGDPREDLGDWLGSASVVNDGLSRPPSAVTGL